MMQCAAYEHITQGTNVRINAICPGGTKTNICPPSLLPHLGRGDLFTEPVCE